MLGSVSRAASRAVCALAERALSRARALGWKQNLRIPLAAKYLLWIGAVCFHPLAWIYRRLTPTLIRPDLPRRVWVTDTMNDLNGVTRTIQALARAAQTAGADLTVLACEQSGEFPGMRTKLFTPQGAFTAPEYPQQQISFPCFLEVLDYIRNQGVTEIIISTPGPMGLAGLAAAKALGLPACGIYHTDFPEYVARLSGENQLNSLAWNYMHCFYGKCDTILVNSEAYRAAWTTRGIAADRLCLLPRGVDSETFCPTRRNATFWPNREARGPVALYVGRLSKEKGLDFLAEVYARTRAERPDVTLALVGDGPHRAALETQMPGAIFTGVLAGEELARAYASADLFVFPSTTDTFGNVIVEAHACGIPALVTNVGGPQELIRAPEDGQVLPADDAAAWTRAIIERLEHPPSNAARTALAAKTHAARSWDRAFNEFWQVAFSKF